MKKIFASLLIVMLFGVMIVTAQPTCEGDPPAEGCYCACVDGDCRWVCDFVPPEQVPALSPMGLVALAGSLGLVAVVMLRRR